MPSLPDAPVEGAASPFVVLPQATAAALRAATLKTIRGQRSLCAPLLPQTQAKPNVPPLGDATGA